MFLLNGSPIAFDTPFTTADGTHVPAGWMRQASPEQRIAFGITEVADPVRPNVDERYYFINGSSAIIKNLDQIKQIKKNELAGHRYNIASAGVTLFGKVFPSDETSKINYIGAFIQASANPDYTVNWKSRDGFINLNAAQVVQLVTAVSAHIQAAFDRESELSTIIDAETGPETLVALDIKIGWPEVPITLGR